MYAVLRSPHLKGARLRFFDCCRKHHLNKDHCICYVNFLNANLIETKRTFTISSHFSQIYNDSRLVSHKHNWNYDAFRQISSTPVNFDKEPLKPSSKVEETVQELKKKEAEEKTKPQELTKVVVKKSLRERVWNEILHYYHGFRLLYIDVKISSGLVWRILNGKSLSRREYSLLKRTVGDLFRLVPFSVFIIIPFMEFLLPFFIKFFPGMLPSTFQTTSQKEDKLKQKLKVQLEMAKFLQGTLDDMAVQHKDRSSKQAKEFVEWFSKVRTSGEYISTEEIMRFVKLFQDEITLDSLSRSQLIALCRVLEVQTLGTNNFLRFQLRMKLRSLAADDKMIKKEGVNTLTLSEVQQACRARGMRAYGMSLDRLRAQLDQWLDLSLNKRVPPSLLLLSRALMLPETIPTSDKLKATISALPETIVKQTQAAIAEKEGKIDNKVRVEILKEEEKKIKEEREEIRVEKKKKDKEILEDKAPILSAAKTPLLEDTAPQISATTTVPTAVPAVSTVPATAKAKDENLQSKDFKVIETAIKSVSKDKKFIVEKGELKELKSEMADYKEDVAELSKAVASQPKPEIQETKAAKRLFKSVNKIIDKLDKVLVDLEAKEKQLKQDLEKDKEAICNKKKKDELLKIDDIVAAVHKIKGVMDDGKVQQIKDVLKKIDDDKDGAIKVEDILRVIEVIGKENVNLSPKQIDELIDLIDKEEILEVENKIEKALQKDKEAKQEASSEALAGDKGAIKKTKDTDPKKNPNPNPSSKLNNPSSRPPTPPPTSSNIDKSKDSTKRL